MNLTASLPLHRYRCTCTSSCASWSSSCKYVSYSIISCASWAWFQVINHQSIPTSFALPCPALPCHALDSATRNTIRTMAFGSPTLGRGPWSWIKSTSEVLHITSLFLSWSQIWNYCLSPTISTFCIFVNLSFLFLSFPNHPPVTLAFLSDSPLVMLFTKSSRRRLETFHIIAIVGAFIFLLKVCYQSVSWPQSYFPTVQLGANNSTLGVCYQLAFLLIPYRRLTNS